MRIFVAERRGRVRGYRQGGLLGELVRYIDDDMTRNILCLQQARQPTGHREGCVGL